MKIVVKGFAHLACACAVLAQAPTGTIAGVARDPSGAAVTGAEVKLISRTDGLSRTAVTPAAKIRESEDRADAVNRRLCS